jgi:hypothetical protein
MREVILELEALECRTLRQHAREQLAQARNVPLAVRQIEQGATACLCWVLPEYLVEAATAGEKVERVVED